MTVRHVIFVTKQPTGFETGDRVTLGDGKRYIIVKCEENYVDARTLRWYEPAYYRLLCYAYSACGTLKRRFT